MNSFAIAKKVHWYKAFKRMATRTLIKNKQDLLRKFKCQSRKGKALKNKHYNSKPKAKDRWEDH